MVESTLPADLAVLQRVANTHKENTPAGNRADVLPVGQLSQSQTTVASPPHALLVSPSSLVLPLSAEAGSPHLHARLIQQLMRYRQQNEGNVLEAQEMSRAQQEEIERLKEQLRLSQVGEEVQQVGIRTLLSHWRLSSVSGWFALCLTVFSGALPRAAG